MFFELMNELELPQPSPLAQQRFVLANPLHLPYPTIHPRIPTLWILAMEARSEPTQVSVKIKPTPCPPSVADLFPIVQYTP